MVKELKHQYINVIAQYDSFSNAAMQVSKMLETVLPKNSKNIRCDFNIVNLSNSKTIKVLDIFKVNRKQVTICCFAGFINKDHESMLSRSCADLILFNCFADFNEYKKIGIELQFSTNNAFCYGYPQLLDVRKVVVPEEGHICFFEQVIVPSTFEQRSYLLNQLVRLANKFPSRKVLIKLRCKPTERTIHKHCYHLESLKKKLKLKFPKNLSFTYEPVERLLLNTSLCITVSSTVAIESLARGIPTAILKDFGVNKKIHTSSFIGSGCLVSFEEIGEGKVPQVNNNWLRMNVEIPNVEAFKNKIEELIELQKNGEILVRTLPSGGFFMDGNFKRSNFKKLKKLLISPIQFCKDSKKPWLNYIATKHHNYYLFK